MELRFQAQRKNVILISGVKNVMNLWIWKVRISKNGEFGARKHAYSKKFLLQYIGFCVFNLNLKEKK